jgi:hypothetical protein
MLSKGLDVWVSIGELLWLDFNVTIFVFRMLAGDGLVGRRVAPKRRFSSDKLTCFTR